MDTFIAQFISGLSLGSTYALIVVGMTLLLLVRGIMHFGFAYIVVMTMCVSWLIINLTGANLAIAIPVFLLTGILLTIATEPLFRPLAQKRAFLESMVLGQGIAIVLTDVMSHFINNGQSISFPSTLAGGGARFEFGIVYFTLADIYAISLSLLSVVLLLFFLYRTKGGKAIRAMAQDQDVARSLGIPFTKTGIVGFLLAGTFAGVAALVLAMTLEVASPEQGDPLAVKAMILMLFAGMGNLVGGIVCALLFGVVEALTLAFVPGRWTEAIIFGVVMLVILWRPNGVFGERH